MHRIRWDDLQIVKAVAECGSASAAATALGVNHATILRRVSAFEKAQGVRLFERHATGYRATAAGRALLQATRVMHATVEDIQRSLLGQDERLSGSVRLTTTDTIIAAGLGQHLQKFQAKHPDIIVHLTITNRRLDIARLDAEVSVRPSQNPPEALVGRRVCGLAFAVYTATGDRPRSMKDIVRWIGIDNELRNSPVDGWSNDHIPMERIVMRADSFAAIRELVRTGAGAAVLPCCLGDQCPDLCRIGDPIHELDTGLWVLTHRDLKSAAKVSALSDFLAKALRGDRRLMEGQRRT